MERYINSVDRIDWGQGCNRIRPLQVCFSRKRYITLHKKTGSYVTFAYRLNWPVERP